MSRFQKIFDPVQGELSLPPVTIDEPAFSILLNMTGAVTSWATATKAVNPDVRFQVVRVLHSLKKLARIGKVDPVLLEGAVANILRDNSGYCRSTGLNGEKESDFFGDLFRVADYVGGVQTHDSLVSDFFLALGDFIRELQTRIAFDLMKENEGLVELVRIKLAKLVFAWAKIAVRLDMTADEVFEIVEPSE